MTKPTSYLIRMLAFLVIVLIIAGLLSGALVTAFVSNPLLNTLILLVLLAGIAWTLTQVTRLTPEVQWVETFQTARGRLAGLAAPRLLAPMASMLAARHTRGREGQERFTLSAPAMRSLLDGLASRLDEGREISRYLTGLLIFLGLLGTFWGLLLTVASVSDVISSMTVGSGDLNALFEQLKSGLGRPLKGMGTAFSASMFGLSGALVLGFLDLTAGQAQNRFFNELEEWLAGLTRLSSGALGGDGEGGSVPVYVQALLETTAENMEGLQSVLSRGEEGRIQANQAIVSLTEKIATLSDTMRASQQLMLRIAETQAQLAPALQRLGEPRRNEDAEAMRAHMRNIEQALQRLLSESEQGRLQSTAELRSDLRVLTRTIAAIAEGQPQ
ncbi:MAG: flagellar motor protein MotA [Acetobacteraceae bacterium]|nr:flagellar motor protein MotA [Acetobacteraceae bacterium]